MRLAVDKTCNVSEMELSSLMNLNGVSDSKWGNDVYKTGRRRVGVELMCRRCGCGYEPGLNGLNIIGGFM